MTCTSRLAENSKAIIVYQHLLQHFNSLKTVLCSLMPHLILDNGSPVHSREGFFNLINLETLIIVQYTWNIIYQ